MAFDLGRAMYKKQEHESARLMDFEFRQRARTWRLLARGLGLDEEALVKRIAISDDGAMLESVAAQRRMAADELDSLFARFAIEARAQLIKEIGDPTPHRLA